MIALSPATRLPVPVPPQPDEAFSCWLVRLAHAHGLRTRSLCSLLTKQQVEFSGDLDGVAGGKVLELVCTGTNRDPERMRTEHTLLGFSGRLFAQIKPTTSTPWLLPTGTFHQRRPAMQFCPACLREGTPYYRRSWRLSLLGICPTHGTRLHHVCPTCAKPVNFIRSQMYGHGGTLTICWHCGAEGRRAATVAADTMDVQIGSALLALAQGKPFSPGLLPGCEINDYFVVLGMLCSRLLGRKPRLVRWRELAAQGAGVVLPRTARQMGAAAFDLLADPTQRLPVLRTAVWLLEQWPERFLEAAKVADTRTSDFVAHFVSCPRWFLEPLQTRLTPLRNEPIPSPGLIKVQRMRQLVLEHRRDWSPTKLPRLIRALRGGGFYGPQTDDSVIMRSLPKLIARLRSEQADYRRQLTRQVARNTPQWSRLLLLAKPYRKIHCKNPEILRRGIKLLCSEEFLSSADLGELLHRSHVVLMAFHLTPMARAGELQTRFGKNRGGSFNYPGQAYRIPPPEHF